MLLIWYIHFRELLEIKEQNAERFYNEESKFIEDDDEQKSSLNNTMQNEDVINLDDDYRKKIEGLNNIYIYYLHIFNILFIYS